MKILVTGKEGTNGPLKKGETYEVIRIDQEELSKRDLFGYAIRPYVVFCEAGEYAPFLGKIQVIEED